MATAPLKSASAPKLAGPSKVATPPTPRVPVVSPDGTLIDGTVPAISTEDDNAKSRVPEVLDRPPA
jgi:hypothetical protein